MPLRLPTSTAVRRDVTRAVNRQRTKLGLPKGSTIAVSVFDADGKRLGLVTSGVDDAKIDEVVGLLPE